MNAIKLIYGYCTAKCPWIFKFMPDGAYLKMVYKIKVGKKLDLKHPKEYNEKLQWLKLHDRKAQYTLMVDKYKVRDYIKEKIGEQYLVPFLGVWEKPEDIDFSQLPLQFVLKCNHDSQGVIICKNKNELDIPSVIKKLQWAISRNFYNLTKEYPYRDVERRIIAERYMDDGSGELKDYKVLCFEGKPRIIEVHSGRFKGEHVQDLYDLEWNKLPIHQSACGLPNAEVPFEKPAVLEEMIRNSEILSQGIHHVRVDWYIVGGKLYFGEITFYDASGFDDFEPDEWNRILGDWIQINE